MMFLSGYTLGFFYPKRAKNLRADRAAFEADSARSPQADKETDPPLAPAPEYLEVPASLYFYRYF
jgi:hypothetical protein